MGILSDWGFSSNSWQGQRGEYWVLTQALLMIAFVLLPVYRPAGLSLPAPPTIYGVWLAGLLLGLVALFLLIKGFIDLGGSLSPIPHPRDDGKLVQTGVYGLVRHPLYSGLVLGAIAWTICFVSVSHLIGTIVLLLFFNAKASREEIWLLEKYPEYHDYRQRVKKLIPGVY